MSNDVPGERVWAREILNTERIGDRCLRYWITDGRFPHPDGNLNGRNFWFRPTYETWKADVAAGRYRQQRRPGMSMQAA